MTTISGVLERITYQNEENGFVVAKLQEKEKRGLTTVVGNLPGIHAGESLRLMGQWVENRKFGEQFKVETFEITVPATLLGIRKYLGSGLIRGIGPIMADRMVDLFGLDTLEIIEKDSRTTLQSGGDRPEKDFSHHRSLEGAEGDPGHHDLSSGPRGQRLLLRQNL